MYRTEPVACAAEIVLNCLSTSKYRTTLVSPASREYGTSPPMPSTRTIYTPMPANCTGRYWVHTDSGQQVNNLLSIGIDDLRDQNFLFAPVENAHTTLWPNIVVVQATCLCRKLKFDTRSIKSTIHRKNCNRTLPECAKGPTRASTTLVHCTYVQV